MTNVLYEIFTTINGYLAGLTFWNFVKCLLYLQVTYAVITTLVLTQADQTSNLTGTSGCNHYKLKVIWGMLSEYYQKITQGKMYKKKIWTRQKKS